VAGDHWTNDVLGSISGRCFPEYLDNLRINIKKPACGNMHPTTATTSSYVKPCCFWMVCFSVLCLLQGETWHLPRLLPVVACLLTCADWRWRRRDINVLRLDQADCVQAGSEPETGQVRSTLGLDVVATWMLTCLIAQWCLMHSSQLCHCYFKAMHVGGDMQAPRKTAWDTVNHHHSGGRSTKPLPPSF